jgi:hypothetical protein
MNPINQVRNKIGGKKFDFLEWMDIIMHEYGMSHEDFKKLRISTFWALCDKINKRYEKESKLISNGRRNRR